MVVPLVLVVVVGHVEQESVVAAPRCL